MSRSIPLLAVTVLVALFVAGCSAPYVNIPHQSGDVAADDPNLQTVRDVEARALAAVYENSDIAAPILIQLPPGTDALTYVTVAGTLGDDVLTPSDEGEPASTLTIEQVRIRGWDAEVDVLRPVGENVRQRVTVYLEQEPFSGWVVQRWHIWRNRIEPAEQLAEQGDAQDATQDVTQDTEATEESEQQ